MWERTNTAGVEDGRVTDEGDPRRQYDDEAFVEAVRTREPASTAEVAEAVGCTRRNADYRLRQLREDGTVESKLVGNSLVWLLAGDG